ncbi:flagellin [Comamonas denitrificans]|uniref:Flagellin n=1 Tax=Comamonas denitrificans TaxID=117506 RepID=A0A939KAL6_9BURK|nr:flagellin [Comamonas denitrificans]MBO1248447.1 flagellin [Comamonas denitrificans]
MSVINTNYLALVSQSHLQKSQSALGTAIERLSSGLRINSAKDDAAGFAIAERFLSNIRGLSQVARDTSDGVSLAQTAQGALSATNDSLQRMRELAVQAGNGTLSSADRQALQKEFDQLSGEVDRVAKSTAFNGQKLLDGSFSAATFQVGPSAGDNVTVGGMANTQVDSLGQSAYASAQVAVDAAKKDSLQADLAAGDVTLTITGADGKNYTSVMQQDSSLSADEALGKFVATVNQRSADTGVTAFLSQDGSSLEYRASVDPGQDPTNVAIAASGSNGFAASGQAQQTQGLRGIDLSSQAGAWEGLQRIDSAIDTVSRSRATLGTVQNRFESAIANISIQNENAVQSRGRMVDANFAKEISNQSRAMILQEMGFAMQAQANQSSRWTLALLR